MTNGWKVVGSASFIISSRVIFFALSCSPPKFKELQDNQGLFPGWLLPTSEPIRNGLAGCPQQLGYFGSASVGAWFITPRFQLFEKFSGL